ncbi:MAG: DUF3108 domain-containing protein [Pseudomonadota bacterium]
MKRLTTLTCAVTIGFAGAVAQDQGPYPEVGTEAWRALFAVDPQPDPLGGSPYTLEPGTRYETTMKGELAGFNIGRIFLNVMVSEQGYSVDYEMEQRGVARWFSDAEATSNASGLFGENGEIVSTYYFNHDYDGEEDQQRTELYREEGAERIRMWSLPEARFRQPVSVEQAEGAIDPLAALVALAFTPVPSGQEPCDRRIPVLDGKRRFDLVMIPEGKEDVRRNGPGRFRGEAYRCRLEQHKIAGYKEKNRGDIEGDIWVYMVEIPEELQTATLKYVPVRMVAKQGLIGASLQAKKPRLIQADGTVTNLY